MNAANEEPNVLAAVARWTAVAGLTSTLLPAAAVTSRLNTTLTKRLLYHWSGASLRALGLSVTVDDRNHGQYDDPPYLFVHLNQTSLIETFVYAHMLPTPLRVVMNFEYALIPVVGASLIAMGSDVVVRQHPEQAKRAINRVARRMRERRESFGISIEGRRSPDGQLSPFKKGAAVLAISAQARVVPFVVRGAHTAMPVGSWRVRPGSLHAIALETIDTRGMSLGDRDALTARLRVLAEAELS